jgi:hypothetical protein
MFKKKILLSPQVYTYETDKSDKLALISSDNPFLGSGGVTISGGGGNTGGGTNNNNNNNNNFYILLENGFYLLQEDGSKIYV